MSTGTAAAVLQFDFSIGPVQTFVSASRSTNDFWAGSFIASWLAGIAIIAAQRQEAEILYPLEIKDRLGTIKSGLSSDGHQFRYALVPNRFSAVVNEAFSGAEVVRQVQLAWQAVADHVYSTYVEDASDLQRVERLQVWRQQIRETFDMQWTLSRVENDFHRRKYWHVQGRSLQRGVKCMLMPWNQEMSLADTFGAGEKFWSAMTARTRDAIDPGERLCAPAVVKRLFRWAMESLPPITLAEATEGDGNDAWTVSGMPLGHKVPSTTEMAGASSFYAILRVDLDNLGSAMAGHDRQVVARIVARFAAEVPSVISEHSGYCYYAGGDDVLAMLPAAQALDCAVELRTLLDRIVDAGSTRPARPLTASAAVLVVHEKAPLAKSLLDCADLLDQVAKEQLGRDSLAVRLSRPGSADITYASPWIKAFSASAESTRLQLAEMATQIGPDELFSSRFIFWLRSFVARINMAGARNASGSSEAPTWPAMALHLIVRKYMRSQVRGGGEPIAFDVAMDRLKPLLALCVKYRRRPGADGRPVVVLAPGLTVEPALLVRFLGALGKTE